MWIEVQLQIRHRCSLQRRGSREPCGSKYASRFYSNMILGRGSREPCGSKLRRLHFTLSDHQVEARESLVDRSVWTANSSQFHWSRLARALWIEVYPSCSLSIQRICRGSREPCGSKFQDGSLQAVLLCRGSREPCGSKCP